MMSDAIRNFPKQFEYEPSIENSTSLGSYSKFLVCGMGGSHLAADLLKTWSPGLDIIIHSDYNLPAYLVGGSHDRLVIASSYSGNTEESLDAYTAALENKWPTIAIATGGELLKRARFLNLPYIQLPDSGIQPRSALGYSIKALMAAMNLQDALKNISELAKSLDVNNLEGQGRELAQKMRGKTPVIYASERNRSLAYNWKIKFNETGKIPAFYNVFPELNHNEMTGFDVKDKSRGLSEKFHFIFLHDSEDYSKIQERMKITQRLYEDRGLPVDVLSFTNGDAFLKMFSSLIVADWAAVYTAELYGLESEQVPMVEELKKLIK